MYLSIFQWTIFEDFKILSRYWNYEMIQIFVSSYQLGKQVTSQFSLWMDQLEDLLLGQTTAWSSRTWEAGTLTDRPEGHHCPWNPELLSWNECIIFTLSMVIDISHKRRKSQGKRCRLQLAEQDYIINKTISLPSFLQYGRYQIMINYSIMHTYEVYYSILTYFLNKSTLKFWNYTDLVVTIGSSNKLSVSTVYPFNSNRRSPPNVRITAALSSSPFSPLTCPFVTVGSLVRLPSWAAYKSSKVICWKAITTDLFIFL